METQPPIEKKSGNKIIIIIGVVLLACVCIAVIAVATLTILGPAIQKTNQDVLQQLEPVQTVEPFQSEQPAQPDQPVLGYSGIADELLKNDVLSAIANYEATQNNCSDVSLISGQIFELDPNRTSADPWIETWQIDVCGASHLYAVSFTPSPQGGTDYSVKPLDQ